ncbi:hypothetical protein JOC45_003247 [Gordonia hydrophobica]|nr:hypothetical protein [Gordonia hydrophobica]
MTRFVAFIDVDHMATVLRLRQRLLTALPRPTVRSGAGP